MAPRPTSAVPHARNTPHSCDRSLGSGILEESLSRLGVASRNAMTRAVPLVITAALVLGCKDGSSPPSDRARLGSRVSVWLPPSTAVLAHEYYSGLGDAVRSVLSDPASWAAVWAQLTFGTQPQTPLPSVDFDTERVLVAALGTRPTGGYDIRVDSLVRYEHGSVAYVTTRVLARTVSRPKP
jgi:hypothetical protein